MAKMPSVPAYRQNKTASDPLSAALPLLRRRSIGEMDRPLTRELTRQLSFPYSYIHKFAAVEVASKLDGFVGSWFEAKVLSLPDQPKSRFWNRRCIHVAYARIVSGKCGAPIKERVDIHRVRPPPPQIVDGEAVGGFEIGDEVDTLVRGGWWAGVVDGVIKRVEEGGEEEEDRFVVRFDDPVREVEFRREELRLHLDWINGKWFVCRRGRAQVKGGSDLC